jgi:hypothetical protein
MSIDVEEAAIRIVIFGAFKGHDEVGDRSFDAAGVYGKTQAAPANAAQEP